MAEATIARKGDLPSMHVYETHAWLPVVVLAARSVSHVLLRPMNFPYACLVQLYFTGYVYMM